MPYRGYYEDIPVTRTADGTTLIDVDTYADGLAIDALFLSHHPERQLNPEQFDKDYKNMLKQNINPVVYQFRPTANDSPSIRYTIMEPRGKIPRLYIRFWYAPFALGLGYSNFDLINPETKEAVFAPDGLLVQYFEYGGWNDLMAFTEAMFRSSPGSDEVKVPETWLTPPGTLIRFSDRRSGVVVGEVRSPYAQNSVPQYELLRAVGPRMVYS